MTDILPYGTQTNDRAIENAIRSGYAPADLSTAPVPEIIRVILEGCWRQDPAAREEMKTNRVRLSAHAVSSFTAFAKIHLDNVPSLYKSHGDGWNIIRNPASTIEYEYEFVEDIIRNVE